MNDVHARKRNADDLFSLRRTDKQTDRRIPIYGNGDQHTKYAWKNRIIILFRLVCQQEG